MLTSGIVYHVHDDSLHQSIEDAATCEEQGRQTLWEV